MELDWITLAWCVAAAFAAGWVDAVVGGGGLIQFPALLSALPGTDVASVSGTNKISSVAGTSMATWSYLRRVRLDAAFAIPLVIAACVGSASGAALVRYIQRPHLLPGLLVVMVLMWLYTWRRPQLGMIDEVALICASPWLAVVIGAMVGLYDGILGPGTGTFFIVGFVVLVKMAWLQASAYAKLANLATNFSAIAVLGGTGHVVWAVGLPMAAANLTGGFLSARLALRYGNAFVRRVFLAVVAVLIVKVALEIFTA